MSTNAKIIVEVLEKYLNHYIKFDESKLPKKLGDIDSCQITKSDNVVYNPPKKNIARKTLIKHRYIAIYHHWDGYIEHLGAELKKRYTTIEDILNLVAFGSMSAILGDTINPYACRSHHYGATWWHYKPIQKDNLNDIQKEEYNYLFKEGKWFVQDGRSNNTFWEY